MTPENSQLQQMLYELLRQSVPDVVVVVPEGIAVLRTGGRHTLIRINTALLEVTQ